MKRPEKEYGPTTVDFNADGRYPYNSLFFMKDQWMKMVTTIQPFFCVI
jgi:hypothetical protein